MNCWLVCSCFFSFFFFCVYVFCMTNSFECNEICRLELLNGLVFAVCVNVSEEYQQSNNCNVDNSRIVLHCIALRCSLSDSLVLEINRFDKRKNNKKYESSFP